MEQRRRQFWLNPEQVELTINCLEYVQTRLRNDIGTSEAHKMAWQYVYRRITELIAIFNTTKVFNNGTD